MIKDFTNPHGYALKPKETGIRPKPKNKEYRIIRIQGMYHVQYRSTSLLASWFQFWWKPCKAYATGKPAVFQTIGEAESFLTAHISITKIYYY